MQSEPIIDDVEVKDTNGNLLSLVDNLREQIVRAEGAMRRESYAAAKELKGLYVDYVFGKLNLMKYR